MPKFAMDDFVAALNADRLRAVEKVKQLEKLLTEKTNRQTRKEIRKEIQNFQIVANFESTMPW